MKILYVTNMYPDEQYPYYGIFVKEQIEAIKDRYPIEYDLYYIEGIRGKKNYLKSINEIHNLLSEKNYDLIHIHHGLSGVFLFKKLKKRIPVLITLHGGDIQKTQKRYLQIFVTKKVLKFVNVAITLNNAMNKVVEGLGLKTEIIPCSVNTKLFRADSSKKRSDESYEFQIVFPSNKERIEKNYSLFEQIILTYEKKYQTRLKTVELKNMSREEVVELFQTSDAMLMTSISEGSPQSVKEAMACNLPVISTNVGDVSVLLDNVENSIVVNSFDVNQFVDALHVSLSKSKSGISGSEKLTQLGLDDDAVSKRIYNLYKKLVGN